MDNGNLTTKTGTLILIGGAEDKLQEKFILRTVYQYCGGSLARITIVPSASVSDESAAEYKEIFTDFGVERVEVVPLFNRRDANESHVVKELESSTGIFIAGGDQSKIAKILHGTRAFAAIQNSYQKHGAIIAGTSAGAAAVSNPMIASGPKGSIPRSGMAKMASGLGLSHYLLVDQHFHQRDRLGRLIAGVLSYPHMLGIGIDEDTAAIVSPDDHLSILGRGTVTIVDACQAQCLNPSTTPQGSPLSFSELIIHMLIAGELFDLNKRSVISKEKTHETFGKSSLSRS